MTKENKPYRSHSLRFDCQSVGLSETYTSLQRKVHLSVFSDTVLLLCASIKRQFGQNKSSFLIVALCFNKKVTTNRRTSQPITKVERTLRPDDKQREL